MPPEESRRLTSSAEGLAPPRSCLCRARTRSSIWPSGDVVGRQPKALQVGIDGAVEIPRLGRLAGSLEVAFGLRLCVSIRFRHNVVKSLSFQMMYPLSS